jgi:hypothetical protein
MNPPVIARLRKYSVKWISLLVVVLFAILVGSLATFYEESLLAATLIPFWALVFTLALYRVASRSLGEKWLLRVVFAGLFIRVPMILAHLAVGLLLYRGRLDFTGYFFSAVELGRKLFGGDLEFFDLTYFLSKDHIVGTQVLKRFLVLGYFLMGPSLLAAFFFSGVIGFLGSYLFLQAFRAAFPSCRETRFLAASLFFFPSLVFWTSLVGKDSLMFFFLGLAAYSIAHLLEAIHPRYVLGLIVSITVITLLRPPIGVVLTLAIGVSFISILRKRSPAMLRPILYTTAGLLVFGALTLVSKPMAQHPSFSSDVSLADNMLALAVHKHIGLSADAEGSALPVQIRDPSASELVRFLPGAMFTFLFRPLVFEAHNVVAFISALDGTLLLMLVLWRWRYLRSAMRSAWSNPFLAFCGVVFLLLAAGLSFEANFGVIVRHRTMVLPFLFILMAVPPAKEDSAGSHVHKNPAFQNLERGSRAPF